MSFGCFYKLLVLHRRCMAPLMGVWGADIRQVQRRSLQEAHMAVSLNCRSFLWVSL